MILVNCEVICIDSGSSDGTLDIIKSFIGQIENYKIIKISGYQNASIARNAGIEKALKDYVFFY
jgi:glycosyltransferase involved in cell wall biosynthesis